MQAPNAHNAQPLAGNHAAHSARNDDGFDTARGDLDISRTEAPFPRSPLSQVQQGTRMSTHSADNTERSHSAPPTGTFTPPRLNIPIRSTSPDAPSSAGSIHVHTGGRRSPSTDFYTPPSPSKSPHRRRNTPQSPRSPTGPFPEVRQATQYLLASLGSPGHRQALYTSSIIFLQTLCLICIAWFALSWFRTYSFEVARTDLVTILRYMLLVLGPLSLWILPALCAISALLSSPYITPIEPPSATSPISFRTHSRPGSFDNSRSADAYHIAAATEDLFHDAETPRFGVTVIPDAAHSRDPTVAEAMPARDTASPPPPPLTPKEIVDACVQGMHTVAGTLSETMADRAATEVRRPLLPATAKPSTPAAKPAATAGCFSQTFRILGAWMRHELYLAALCTLAGYGTLAFALFDRDVLTRAAGAIIVTSPTPQLQSMTRAGSIIMFFLYSILLTSGCLCALMSLCWSRMLRRGTP